MDIRRLSQRARIRIGLLSVAILLVAVVVAALLPRPTPIVAPVAPHVPIAVTSRIIAGSSVVGVPVTVAGHALGTAPLAALELWAGSRRVATKTADRASRGLYAYWDWAPTAAGEAILFVRATDVLGRVAQSNAVRMRVAAAPSARAPGGPAPRYAAPARRPTAADAVQSPTLDVKVTGCTAELTVAGVSQSATGLSVLGLPPLAARFTTLASVPKTETKLVIPVGSGLQLLTVAAFDSSTMAYSDPVVVDAPSQCEAEGWSGPVHLASGKLVVDAPLDADGAYFYLTADAGAAVRVPSQSGTFLERTAPGVFDAAPYLPALSTASLTVEAWGWKGGQLVKLGSGSWTAPQPPKNSGPTAGGVSEAGWKGASDQLLQAGAVVTTLKVKQTVLAASGVPDVIVGDAWALAACGNIESVCGYRLVDAGEVWVPGQTKHTFHWTTLLPGVTSLVWQVLPYAPPASAGLTPPFLFDSDIESVAPGTSEGEFDIDFAPYLSKDSSGELAAGPSASAETSVAKAIELALAPKGGSAVSASGPSAGAQTGIPLSDFGASVGSAIQLPETFPKFGGASFYVRIVPMQGASPATGSKAVHLDVVDPPSVELAAPSYAPNLPKPLLSWQFKAPMGMDPHYARCAIVVGLTSEFKAPADLNSYYGKLYQAYKAAAGDPTKTFCYDPPDGGWSVWDAFEAIVEFVSDVVDFVSAAYDSIKNAIISVLASPCDLIPGATAEDCKPLAGLVLDAVLISAGIPPSIPNFSEVIAGLKGDLASAVVSLAKNVPGLADVCDAAQTASAAGASSPTCEDLAKQAIDEVVKHVEAQQSKAATQAAGIIPYPGVLFAPDPRGLWSPPTFVVKVTNPGAEATRVCNLTADLHSTSYHEWNTLVDGKNVETDGWVSGDPFDHVWFTLPGLAPGETLTREVVLTELVEWYPDKAAKMAAAWGSGAGGYGQTWTLLDAGSKVTAELRDSSPDHPYMGYNACVPGGTQQQGPFTLEFSGNK